MATVHHRVTNLDTGWESVGKNAPGAIGLCVTVGQHCLRWRLGQGLRGRFSKDGGIGPGRALDRPQIGALIQIVTL